MITDTQLPPHVLGVSSSLSPFVVLVGQHGHRAGMRLEFNFIAQAHVQPQKHLMRDVVRTCSLRGPVDAGFVNSKRGCRPCKPPQPDTTRRQHSQANTGAPSPCARACDEEGVARILETTKSIARLKWACTQGLMSDGLKSVSQIWATRSVARNTKFAPWARLATVHLRSRSVFTALTIKWLPPVSSAPASRPWFPRGR